MKTLLTNKVVLKLDDIDRHDDLCDCGCCNANGHSYGVGIYLVNHQWNDLEDVDPDALKERVYAPSEESAFYDAKLWCEENGYSEIVYF